MGFCTSSDFEFLERAPFLLGFGIDTEKYEGSGIQELVYVYGDGGALTHVKIKEVIGNKGNIYQETCWG